MNPVTVQILNQAEKQRRAKQLETPQLCKQSGEARSARSNPLEPLVESLATLIRGAAQQLRERNADPVR